MRMVSTRHHPGEFPAPVLNQTSKPTEKRHYSGWVHTPSKIVTFWLLISVPIVLWDAGYVLLRPHSMPGGSLHYLWAPYALYGTVDYMYGWPAYNSNNGFTAAQSVMNLIESVSYLFYLAVVFRHGASVGPRGGSKKFKRNTSWFLFADKSVDGKLGAIALLLVFTGCVMTLSKTILYGK